MASSRVEVPVLWSAAASTTLSSATRVLSDVFAINAETSDWMIQIDANPASQGAGDTCNVYLYQTAGDVDGSAGDDYDTNKHAQLLCVLDISNGTNGEDPARKSIDGLCPAAGKYRLGVDAPNGATRNVVVRARAVELRRA